MRKEEGKKKYIARYGIVGGGKSRLNAA